MSKISDEMILSRPALGQDVQLGMLYNARSSQFFAGISLWDSAVVNPKQELDDGKVQNADFKVSYSLEEARRNSSLDAEGLLSLDLGIFSATGSAEYLNYRESSTHEARVDVSCTITRRTRRIPQEVLASIKYMKYLDDPRYTHYVSEVTEGGSATLSFFKSCSSAEEAKKATGELKVGIVRLPVSGSARVEFLEQDKSKFENVRISYSGAIAENVSNLEDARRTNRLIRHLDDNIVAQAAEVLKAGVAADLELRVLLEHEVFQKQFPAIKNQISNLRAAFSAAGTEFRKDTRRILLELRDGTTNESEKMTQLQVTVALFQRRIKFAEQYIGIKDQEAKMLGTTVKELLDLQFENHLGGSTLQSLINDGDCRLLLSLGGPSIGRVNHPLQAKIELPSGVDFDATGSQEDDSDNYSDDEDEEWFEDQLSQLQQRLVVAPGIKFAFGVASIDKACFPGKKKRIRTSVGDIVLDYQGKRFVVTGMLPGARPRAPQLMVEGQNITVVWLRECQEHEQAIPTTSFIIRYRRRLNTLKGGTYPQASEDEPFTEIKCDASKTDLLLSSLSDDCDYEVALRVCTILGESAWSDPTVARTTKLPLAASTALAASELIDFFNRNRAILSEHESTAGGTPWSLRHPNNRWNGKKSLFLGLTEVARHKSSDRRFLNKDSVRIVDVAIEFKPEIKAASIEDVENTVVAVFIGASGHGKSTEINAFISYLLGGRLDDPADIMVIDDCEVVAEKSCLVTQIVTCFRIRPLSPIFNGKTLLIVDTPGYGNSRSFEQDGFVTAAMYMSEFFKTVNHVNAIILTCRANQICTTFFRAVLTYVLSLFATEVHGSLRTIYTFSGAGVPPAHATLAHLGWPVENGEVSVNNSAFITDLNSIENDIPVHEGWARSAKGQFQVMRMLLCAPAIRTESSALMTRNRISLEQKCEFIRKGILRTANSTRSLVAGLSALALAVGTVPADKIKVKENRSVEVPMPEGKSTTVCIDCNFTCHEICECSGGGDNANCVAMVDGNCTKCRGHCDWKRHKKSKFKIVFNEYSVWVVPPEAIERWNTDNNSLEGALLTTMGTYLRFQEGLRNDIKGSSQELRSTALLHDPTSLIGYMDTLIQAARVRGALLAQLAQLVTARNSLIIERDFRDKGKDAMRDLNILIDIVWAVRKEVKRRMGLSASDRAKEEQKPCSLYNDLLENLPVDIRDQAPPPLIKENKSSKGALYPENLQGVAKLVQVVLSHDGGIFNTLRAFIITGFLGSGKTTLILNLLPQLPPPPTYTLAILKNEFGDVAVDSLLTSTTNPNSSSVSSVTELLNGCICCNLVGQLSDAIFEILRDVNPSRIVIETSGSAFPATLAMEVNRIAKDLERKAATDSTVKRITLDGVISVIDVENWKGYEDTSYTAKLQAKYTDLIVMNKWEVCDERRLDDCVDRIRDVSEETPWVKSNKGSIDVDLVFGIDGARIGMLEEVEEEKGHESNGHGHGNHNDEVEVLSVRVPKKGQGLDVGKFLELLKKAPRDEIYRIKGIAWFANSPEGKGEEDAGRYIFNWAFGRWTFTPFPENSVGDGGMALKMTIVLARGESNKWTKKVLNGGFLDYHEGDIKDAITVKRVS
ncbi:hypothetical protein TWF192_003049 [Orbilia oligospora]|uniref:Uncharacterized protein n=1 Tax=Orbilia oligospora TaxID=2813651 RepID=A0A6G1MDQ7_ORBOL|nr:hypothetical protein TWF679_008624 [Orbilia oligospora]KAF3254969.1 hypothetical protein TWF192_003049 [Orbilia oligospora]